MNRKGRRIESRGQNHRLAFLPYVFLSLFLASSQCVASDTDTRFGSINDRQSARIPAIEAHLDVDVVIIGGGITGAICAYLFADAGVRVALVESKTVGHGSTAASTALLMQEPDRDFSDLAGRFGRAAARESGSRSRARHAISRKPSGR